MVVVFLNFRYKFYGSFFFVIMNRNFSFPRQFGVIFFKKILKLTSSLIPCNVEKHVEKLLQFTDLSNMTCVHCRVKDKLSIYMKTPSCIQKKKLKLCFCVWIRMTWPRFSESIFSSKISSHNFWKAAQLSKMVWAQYPVTRVFWCSVFSQPIGSYFPFKRVFDFFLYDF